MPAEGEAEAGRLDELLAESGALLEGHFSLSSGRHSERYVQCARLLEDPARARWTGRRLADLLRPYEPDSIVSPALGGLLIGHETASALEVPFRFTERKKGVMTMRRGFELAEGERVAIVEDVVTTGRSTGEAAEVVAGRGAELVAVGSIIDRTSGASPFDVPYVALTRLAIASWDAAECPLCAAGSSPRKPGSRASS